MQRTLPLTLSLSLLLSAASAQQATTPQPQTAAQMTGEAPDQASIDSLLRRYEKAYDHQSLDELLAVWPSLQNDKKQFQRIKGEFGRADVSDVKISMQTQQTIPATNGDLLVRCARTEEYTKLQTTSYSSGDNMMGSMPAQNPGPAKLADKKQVRKSAEVWLTLHKSGTAWTIASVSDKKPH